MHKRPKRDVPKQFLLGGIKGGNIMNWYDFASEEELKKLIVEWIMRDTGCAKEEAETYYKVATLLDNDLWEMFEEDLEDYFADDIENDSEADYMSDAEYYGMKGVKSGSFMDKNRYKPFR